MSTNFPSSFKGKLSFFMSVSCGKPHMIVVDHDKDGKCWADNASGYARLSDPFEVDVPLFDVREKQIERLEKEIEKERAASFQRIQVMLGQIQELRAIEVMHEH